MVLHAQVERELLEQYESELLEKEHSGCAALMRNDKARALRILACSLCCAGWGAYASSTCQRVVFRAG